MHHVVCVHGTPTQTRIDQPHCRLQHIIHSITYEWCVTEEAIYSSIVSTTVAACTRGSVATELLMQRPWEGNRLCKPQRPMSASLG